MKRVIANIWMMTCLLLFLAAGALWVRARFRHDRFMGQRDYVVDGVPHKRLIDITFSRGGFGLFAGETVYNLDAMVLPMDGYGGPFPLREAWRQLPDRGLVFEHIIAPPVPPMMTGTIEHRDLYLWERVGLQYRTATWSDGQSLQRFVKLRIPHWLLMSLAAIPPALRARKILRARRRRKRGLCLNCGYDLRASPDRCPECGMEREPSGDLNETA